jgi:hypothetical protein
MIPSLREVVFTHTWLAKRYRTSPRIDHRRVEEALAEAFQLSQGHPEDEPAALFYVFARRARALPGTWEHLAPTLARNHATRLGVPFHVPSDAIAREDLLLAVAGRLLTFDELRARLAAQ